MMEYIVIEKDRSESLEQEVNDKMSEGFELVGGASVS